MAQRSVLALLAAALLLAGCAPAALGSRSNPYDLRTDPAVVATRGSTTYVVAAFEHGTFDYRASDLAGRWIPWGADGAAATATALFSLRDVVAPDGWRLEIDQVLAFESARRTGVAVEAALRLDVPAGARLGGQRIRATLEARNGSRATFEIVVQVVP